jgi:hypothetical protein
MKGELQKKEGYNYSVSVYAVFMNTPCGNTATITDAVNDACVIRLNNGPIHFRKYLFALLFAVTACGVTRHVSYQHNKMYSPRIQVHLSMAAFT